MNKLRRHVSVCHIDKLLLRRLCLSLHPHLLQDHFDLHLSLLSLDLLTSLSLTIFVTLGEAILIVSIFIKAKPIKAFLVKALPVKLALFLLLLFSSGLLLLPHCLLLPFVLHLGLHT